MHLDLSKWQTPLSLSMKTKALPVGSLAFAAVCFILIDVEALGSTLIFSDDFTAVNPVWQFALTDTQNNATAISASYGKIENGSLQLKANVGAGWNYLYSWATLNLVPPSITK